MCTTCTTRITRTTALFLPLEGGAKKRLHSSKTTAPYCYGPTPPRNRFSAAACVYYLPPKPELCDWRRGQSQATTPWPGGGSRPFRGTALPPVEPSVPSAPRAREHCVDEGASARTRAPQLRAVLVQSVVARSSVGRAVACFRPAAAWQFSADQLCLCVRPAAGQEGPVLLQNLLNCQRGF